MLSTTSNEVTFSSEREGPPTRHEPAPGAHAQVSSPASIGSLQAPSFAPKRGAITTVSSNAPARNAAAIALR